MLLNCCVLLLLLLLLRAGGQSAAAVTQDAGESRINRRHARHCSADGQHLTVARPPAQLTGEQLNSAAAAASSRGVTPPVSDL